MMYERYAKIVAGERLPAALVDLDMLDANIATFAQLPLPIRVATKSVRSVDVLRYIRDKLGARARGLMCYTATEALHLAGHGFDDLFVAYPSVQRVDVEAMVALAEMGKLARIAVDHPAHLSALSAAAVARGVVVPVIVDIDTSYRPFGLRLGAMRSPLHTTDEIVAFAESVRKTKGLRLDGLMAYEAHIAGTTDARAVMRVFKAAASRDMRRRRQEIARRLPGMLFNGAGTGTAGQAAKEPALTEITVGSGFYAPRLFDDYRTLQLQPAACFALRISRVAGGGSATALGGGFVASGAFGRDRLPTPYLPAGMRLVAEEGAGEVQTPLTLPEDMALQPGDPVFFRHAKAGELLEHFREVLLIRGAQVHARALTYRGEGAVFL
jgi:D-serine deaminase-like pyridoxal phosphate-dependent protein